MTAGAVGRSNVGTMTYLAPAGSLAEAAGAKALAEAVSACILAKKLHLVLDLEQVSLLAGKALETILDTFNYLSRHGGGLMFINPSALVKDILIATGLGDTTTLNAGALGGLHLVGADYPGQEKKLGEILLEMGLVNETQLAETASRQAVGDQHKRLGEILVDKGTISERDLFQALSRQLHIPQISLRAGLYEEAAIRLISRETARRLEVLPMFRVHDILTLATNDPQAIPALDEIRDITGCQLRLVLAQREEILKIQIDAYSGQTINPELIENMPADLKLVEHVHDDFNAIDEMAGASPIINLVNNLIQRAVHDGASDIHIECNHRRSLVRFRIDGVLYEALSLGTELHPAVVSRLKVMGNLDIAERRLPQDGRMQVVTQGRSVDLRFSSLPSIHGEKVVLRVLDKNQSILDIEKLGMSVSNLARLKKILGRSYGLILATGPTGSGKTTTLYACINYLKSIEKNIVTIEEPVEYQLDIINQNQVNEAIGLSFAKLLKHVLRQDPDIIMVGEIRDRETAEIAVQAALTGHLVLSTLHTNDAVGALSRLVNMGVEPYLLSSALAGVVAQRLVRHVCPACKTLYLPSPDLADRHGWPEGTRLVRGRGCASCYDSGYRGRLGIHEIIEASEDLQRLMIKNPSKEELREYTQREGYATLFDDGMQRALQGLTSFEEFSRVIQAG